jgi:uncharacterized repeat protein (TIGR01451 family)
VDDGFVTNGACADSAETEPPVCDTVIIPLARLEIEKTSAEQSYDAVGDVIHYTITATNTGNMTLTDVVVTDEMLDVALADFSCVPAVPVAEFAVDDDPIVCTGTYTITQEDLDNGSVLNTACADSDETPQVCDEVTIPGDQTLTIVVDKTANVESPLDAEGGDVTFTYTVTNTSNITAVITKLGDDKFKIDGDEDCQVGTILPPGASCSFDETFFVKPEGDLDDPDTIKPHVNVFTACIAPATGGIEDPACDDDPAEVPFIGGLDPTPSQPPTDTLVPTDVAGPGGMDMGAAVNWILWVLLTATLILSGAWVIRRQRYSEILLRK